MLSTANLGAFNLLNSTLLFSTQEYCDFNRYGNKNGNLALHWYFSFKKILDPIKA
jgi:hypothetical protein